MNPNNVVITLLVGILLGLLAVGSAASATVMDAARTQAWETQNLETLKALFSDKDSVESFLKEVKPGFADVGASVGEYEISDLNNDGRVELVATIDFSGRAIYNTIYVVEKVNDVFRAFDIWAPGINILNLRSRIVDLNHDGAKEILVPRLLATPQFGTDPRPIINDVYEWDGAGYVKANVYFKDYYHSLLRRLKCELEAVRLGRKLDVSSQKAMLEKKYEREIEAINEILKQ